MVTTLKRLSALPIIHNVTADPFEEEDEFEKQCNIFDSDIYSILSHNYSGIALKENSGFITITHSIKQENSWQVTYFTKNWLPLSDSQCRTTKDIFEKLNGYTLQILEIII